MNKWQKQVVFYEPLFTIYRTIIYCAVTEASQDRLWGNDEASLEGVLPWIHVNHGAEVHHLEEAHVSTFHDEVSQTSFTTLMLLLFQ